MEETKPADGPDGRSGLGATMDDLLLERLQARHPETCAAFVDAHYRGVYRFFLWLTRDPDCSADLTQEAFAAFWQSVDRLEPGTAPDLKAWLYGVARNGWRRRCRCTRPLLGLDEAVELPDPAPGPEAFALSAFEGAEVARAVADLPADYREALVLRVFQEMEYSQVAAALGVTETLARWRVHQARGRLRAALRPAGERKEAARGGRA